MATTTFNLTTDSVWHRDGSLDLSATRAKFDEVLNRYHSAHNVENDTIMHAVNNVFSRNVGQKLTTGYVVSQAVQVELNAQSENHDVLTDRVQKFLRANASTKREDGKPFGILLGRTKHGSCVRWADVPVETK